MAENRDPGIEAAFMRDLRDLVRQLRGASFNPSDVDIYERHIADRLRLGAERYGADAFMGRDNLVEVAPESADIAAYGVLDLQRLRDSLPDDAWQEMRMHLITAAAYAALADVQVRAARRARDLALVV